MYYIPYPNDIFENKMFLHLFLNIYICDYFKNNNKYTYIYVIKMKNILLYIIYMIYLENYIIHMKGKYITNI